MPNPAVSVIIPTYNRAPQLRSAIASVLSQTFSNLDLIIVDDGSKDETADVVRSFVDDRIRYFYQRNQGQAIATNEGMGKVRGEWIAFLDSDDVWLPNKLEMQLQALNQFGPARQACFTDANYVNNPQLRTTAFKRAKMHFRTEVGVLRNTSMYLLTDPHGIYVQSLVMRADLLKRVDGFDPTLRIFLDKDFIFRLSRATEFGFVNLPLLEIDRDTNRPEGLIELFENEAFRLRQLEYLYNKWLKLDGLSGRERSMILAHLAEIYSGRASWLLFNKDFSKAKAAMWDSIRAGHSLKSVLKYFLIAVSPAGARKIVVGRENWRAKSQAVKLQEQAQ